MFEWDVQIGDERGAVHEIKYRARWSPSKDFVTPESIAAAAAAEATVEHKQRFVPMHATLAGPVKA